MNHLAVVTDRELSDVVEEDNAGSSLEANNQFWTNRFIQHQRREGISDEFTLRDMAILYRYAIGDLPVYDVNTGETKNIQSASDFSLLSYSNITAKIGGLAINDGLRKLYVRRATQNNKRGTLTYPEIICAIIQDEFILTRFGIISEKHHIQKPVDRRKYSDDDNLSEFQPYLLGIKPIYDKDLQIMRRVQSIDDLTLLSPINIAARENQIWMNLDARRVYHRIQTLFDSGKSTQSYEKVINTLLEEPEVRSHLNISEGEKATYKSAVNRNTSRSKPDNLKLLILYLTGKKPTRDSQIDGTPARTIDTDLDLELLKRRNVIAIDDNGNKINPELNRIYRRKKRDGNNGWGSLIDSALAVPEVIERIGTASYDADVAQTGIPQLQSYRSSDEMIDSDIKKLFERHRSSDLYAKAQLIEHYLTTTCADVCKFLYYTFDNIEDAFSSSTDLLGYAYDSLIHQLEREQQTDREWSERQLFISMHYSIRKRLVKEGVVMGKNLAPVQYVGDAWLIEQNPEAIATHQKIDIERLTEGIPEDLFTVIEARVVQGMTKKELRKHTGTGPHKLNGLLQKAINYVATRHAMLYD